MKQMAPIDITAPGSLGLNSEGKNTVLPTGFATRAQNCIIDSTGVLASREGWTSATTTLIAASANVESLFEYVKADGTTLMIVGYDGNLASGAGALTDPDANSVSGSVTDTNGTWWFQNFNDKVLGFQAGQKLIIKTSGNFATVVETGGTAPTGGVACCAYGRVWQSSADGKDLVYCDLLDEADWAGGGTVSMQNIWTNGQDHITAIAAFNGALVVFGLRHIVFIVDDQGSALGLDPANAYVADVLTGTGCLDQHTVQPVGEADLLFLSPTGVQSLGRVVQEKSNPTNTISKLVTTELLYAYRNATAGTIRSTYSIDDNFYILSFPATGTYVFDIGAGYKDESGALLAPCFFWDLKPTALCTRLNGTVLMGFLKEVGTLTGTTDDGVAIAVRYESPWLDLGEEFANHLKILKRIGSILSTNQGGTVTYKWATDFSTVFNEATVTFEAGALSEWAIAEWGIGEWGGSQALRIKKIPARDKGQYYKVGVSIDATTTFTLHQVELFTKVGRLA